MGINPAVSILIIALGAFLMYLVVAMHRILSTAPMLSPLAAAGAVVVMLLGIYMLVAVRDGRRS